MYVLFLLKDLFYLIKNKMKYIFTLLLLFSQANAFITNPNFKRKYHSNCINFVNELFPTANGDNLLSSDSKNNILKKNNLEDGNFISFHEEEIPDSEEIAKITSYFMKNKWLRILENDNISLYDKISLIESYRNFEKAYAPNILAGGLMNDYNNIF